MIQVRLVESKTSNEQRKGRNQFSSFSRGKTSVMKQAMRTKDEVSTTAKGKT